MPPVPRMRCPDSLGGARSQVPDLCTVWHNYMQNPKTIYECTLSFHGPCLYLEPDVCSVDIITIHQVSCDGPPWECYTSEVNLAERCRSPLRSGTRCYAASARAGWQNHRPRELITARSLPGAKKTIPSTLPPDPPPPTSNLKAFASTTGITVLIFATRYVAKRYHPDLFSKENFSRKHSKYSSIPNDPLEARPNRRRRSLGEKLRMWDVGLPHGIRFILSPSFRRSGWDSER